jgi:hypothetical protein
MGFRNPPGLLLAQDLQFTGYMLVQIIYREAKEAVFGPD